MGQRKPDSYVWPPLLNLREKATSSPPLLFQLWFNTCTNLVMAKGEKSTWDYWYQRTGSCCAGFREGATGFGTSLGQVAGLVWHLWGRALVKVSRSQLIGLGFESLKWMLQFSDWEELKPQRLIYLMNFIMSRRLGGCMVKRGERSFWNPSALEFSWLSGLMSGQRHRRALASSANWKWQVTDETFLCDGIGVFSLFTGKG